MDLHRDMRGADLHAIRDFQGCRELRVKSPVCIVNIRHTIGWPSVLALHNPCDELFRASSYGGVSDNSSVLAEEQNASVSLYVCIAGITSCRDPCYVDIHAQSVGNHPLHLKLTC